MKRTLTIGVGLALVGVLAGCTGGGQEPAGLSTATAEPSPTTASTPSPSPTSIVGQMQDMSDPELGIVFDDAPALSGDEADVYNWVATFEQEYWRTLKTNQASPAFSVFTSADVQARMAEIAANNAAGQSKVGGVFHVRISDISVDGDSASATTCDDYGQVLPEDGDGPQTLDEVGLAVPVLLQVTLTRNTAGDGLWTIETSTQVGKC